MARALVLDGCRIADETDCYVIAEIGHNHQGDLETAKLMFRRAKECGAHAVKLQKRSNRTLFTAAMYSRPYAHEHSFGRTYGEHREALEFGRSEYVELQHVARELGLTLFATAFDTLSADFLASIDVPAYKVASGDLRNVPLLRHVAGMQKPVILSTGTGTQDDVDRAVETIVAINPQLCILQCTSSYPTAACDMHLRVIETFRHRYRDLVVGLSDHYNGIAMAVAAYILGARVIEKHFTLNHTWKGSDHALSLEPAGLRRMVRDLGRVREALGAPTKEALTVEADASIRMGKKLVAARPLPVGHVLEAGDLAIKSPGDGLPPTAMDAVVGRALRCPLKAGEDIVFEVLTGQVQRV